MSINAIVIVGFNRVKSIQRVIAFILFWSTIIAMVLLKSNYFLCSYLKDFKYKGAKSISIRLKSYSIYSLISPVYVTLRELGQYHKCARKDELVFVKGRKHSSLIGGH